ncbi:hypothetical protein LCGC14_1771080, partial [marine sediment metagenome]
NIESNFGDREVQETIKRLFNPKVIESMGGYRNFMKVLKAAKWAGGIIASATVAGAAFGLTRGGGR